MLKKIKPNDELKSIEEFMITESIKDEVESSSNDDVDYVGVNIDVNKNGLLD